jgi:hypothetical protein
MSSRPRPLHPAPLAALALATLAAAGSLAACDDANGYGIPDAAPPDAGPDAAPPASTPLATGLFERSRLQARGGYVYYLGEGTGQSGLFRVSAEGGPAEEIRDGAQPVGASDFVVTGTSLFFIGYETDGAPVLKELSLAFGGEATTRRSNVASFYQHPLAAAGVDRAVYHCYGDNFTSGLCTSERFDLLTTNPNLYEDAAIAGDGEGIYWNLPTAQGDEIHFAPHEGLADVAVVDKQIGIDFIALDQSSIYWASRELGYVRRAAKDGLEPSILAHDQGTIGALLADDGDAFWSVAIDDAGHAKLLVLRAGEDAPETIVPRASDVFTIDPEHVFYVLDGSLYAIPR